MNFFFINFFENVRQKPYEKSEFCLFFYELGHLFYLTVKKYVLAFYGK